MSRLRALLMVCALIMSFNAFSLNLSGIEVEEQLKIDDAQLKLNGAGVREKIFMDIYVISLYVKNSSSDPKQLLSEDIAITLDIVSSMLSKKKMVDAITDGFNTVTNNNLKPIQMELNQFSKLLGDELNRNDQLIFLKKGAQLTIYKNGDKLGMIESETFASDLFNIWIGDSPIKADLKDALLGKKM